jgi:hypothetical protein
MKHGKHALEPLKELNPKMDTVFGLPGWPVGPPKSEREMNDDLAYYLQIQSSLSHIQEGMESVEGEWLLASGY